MDERRERVLLTEAQETLLIPLVSKAIESGRPNGIFRDEKAQEIVARVDYDFERLATPRKTVVTLCIRANKLDACAREFLRAHRDGVVLHLGCGLDSRCLRVERAGADWYDLDVESVIALRRMFYREEGGYHMIASSVTDLRWVDAIRAEGRPVLVIAEGLLMYLREEDVRALLLRLQSAFAGCELVADVFSEMTARRVGAHRSLAKTGATIHWGIDDAREIERWSPGIRLVEEWYFARAPEIARLSAGYRAAFKLAGWFAAANKAQRIVRYVLGAQG